MKARHLGRSNGDWRGLSSARVLLYAAVIHALGGCVSVEVTTKTANGSVAERRSPVEPGPVVSSSWQREGDLIRGSLTWRNCSIDRQWSTTTTRIERKTPRTALGVAEIIAGAGVVILAATQVRKQERDCGTGMEGAIRELYGQCTETSKPRPEWQVAGLAGVGLIAAGIVTVARRPSVEEQVVSTKPERTSGQGSCMPEEDLRELALVLRLAPRRFLPVRLDTPDKARIQIPDDVELPTSEALPIVVYRAPRNARDVLTRGQVIGYLQPSEGPNP